MRPARLLLRGPSGAVEIELRPVHSLGRHPGCSTQLLDKRISKEHCVVELRGEDWILRDLGTLGGTFVNDVRVEAEVALEHGDRVGLGSTWGWLDDGRSPVPLTTPSDDAAPWTSPPVPALLPGTPLRQPPGGCAAVAWVFDLGDGTKVIVNDRTRLIAEEISVAGEVAAAESSDGPASSGETEPRLAELLDSVMRSVDADRGVVFLVDGQLGILAPRAALRRGPPRSITVSSTILNHVVTARVAVLTHDSVVSDGRGKAATIVSLSSAIATPLMRGGAVRGVLWIEATSIRLLERGHVAVIAKIGSDLLDHAKA